MKTLDIFRVFCCVVYWLLPCQAKRGFILTAPKAIDAGSTEYFTLTVFEVPQGGLGRVTLRLLHRYTGALLSESEVHILNNYSMWVEMTIPPAASDVKAKLQVLGSFVDGYRVDTEKDVRIRHNSVITFVQTDKPLYKPGQTVKFRILPMDSQLKPLDKDTEGDVWIEDPSGIRVAQWKNITFTESMVQLELPLSEEPTLGTWSIKSIVNRVSHTQNFNVEKYVLPKFEVRIKPPEYVMADAEAIATEICAWYTYGKKVDGTLKAKITYQRLSWETGERPIPSVEHLGQISGCHTFVVNSRDLLLPSAEFGYRTLEVLAEVVENGTEIVANASTTLKITHSPLKIKFLGGSGSNNDYFKPGIPFYGKLQVELPDGRPAASEKIEICISFKFLANYASNERQCHTFTSNKNGRIRFSVAPKPPTVVKIFLQAQAINYESQKYGEEIWREKIEIPHGNMELQSWYSPSGSYLQIEPIIGELQCEKLQRVKVRYTAERSTTIKFYHQVLSRGRIVQQGSHQRTFYFTDNDPERFDLGENGRDWLSSTSGNNGTGPPNIGEFVLSFDPRTTMSPVARLLVFYVREDGEVVADTRMFRIATCLLNKVNLHFRHEKQYPSTEAALLLSASPSSVCGISLVDKSIRLIKQDTQFDKKKLFKLMESYDVSKNDLPRQVNKDYCMQKEAGTTVEETKPLSTTGPSAFRPFFRSVSAHVDAAMAFEEAGMVVISDLELETRPCVRSEPVAIALEIGSRDGIPYATSVATTDSSVWSRHRGNFAGEYKPQAAPDKEAETEISEEIRSYFPETWLWEMHTIGVSGEVALRRQLPHTITEWVGGAVCIHSKTGLGISDTSSITAFQPFFLSFQLPYSVVRGEVLPLVVSVFNYLSECLPITLALEPSEEYKTISESRFHKVCVCGGESNSHRFVLKPVTLGTVNITVYGYSMEEEDEVCGNEITVQLSARDAVTKQLLVEAEGFAKEEIFNYYVCPENTNGSYATEIDLLLPEDVVEGSSRAFMSVTGDLMGPALNGLRSLVKLPVGCGEQNMVLFTPNIFVLDYLTATNQVTAEIKAECINNMKTGYQRELQYRHGDGSYSVFGQKDPEGSLWLTAFVVKSFGQARRFVDIDEQDLRLSTSWILERQFENGCFEPSGFLLNKAMKGGLSDGEHSLAPLAAYVLIALLESGAEMPDHAAIRNGLKCLEAEASPSSYALALFAYANALAKEEVTAKNLLGILEERAIHKGSQMFWEFHSKGATSKSVAVEIAGYYILTKTELGGSESAAQVMPVLRWITRQRNSNGGFVSTQDTVVALQALARYAALYSRKTLDMGLVVESDDLVQGFKLDENNKLVTQSVRIPVLPAVLDFQAVGDGCALMQCSLRYNVEKIFGSDAFDLNIDAVRLGSSDCNLPRIGICMRYKVFGQTSNMIVVAVKLASGFLPDEWSLYKLQSDSNVQLKRHEVDGNQVNLYFDELTNEQKCFIFFIKSEIEVEDIKPAAVHLYDYYQPELKITKEYTIPSACTVSALPELPWLPPLLIDTEDDNDEFDLSPFPKISSTTNFDETTTVDITNTTETFAATDVPETSSVSVDVIELSDDADSFQSDGNMSHLSNFVDFHHELDFSDGSEENTTVSVRPPEGFIPAQNDLADKADCPVCGEDLADNFTEIYCHSAFALRVIVRDAKTGFVKVLQDVSPYLPQPLAVKKFAKLIYEESCNCPQLNQDGNSALLVGTPISLWNMENKKHSIRLTSGVYVLTPPLKAVQPAHLKKTRSSCDADP